MVRRDQAIAAKSLGMCQTQVGGKMCARICCVRAYTCECVHTTLLFLPRTNESALGCVDVCGVGMAYVYGVMYNGCYNVRGGPAVITRIANGNDDKNVTLLHEN